jgi:hypothetical protein
MEHSQSLGGHKSSWPDKGQQSSVLAARLGLSHPFLDFCTGQKNQLSIPLSCKWHPSQSRHLALQAVAGAATSSVTTKLGKWVTSKSSKVSPSDCVRIPEGATKDPSLILGSLEKPCVTSLTCEGQWVTESSPCIFWGLPYLLSISPLIVSIEFPALWDFICSAPIKELSHYPSEALKLVCLFQRMFSCPKGFKMAFVLISQD